MCKFCHRIVWFLSSNQCIIIHICMHSIAFNRSVYSWNHSNPWSKLRQSEREKKFENVKHTALPTNSSIVTDKHTHMRCGLTYIFTFFPVPGRQKCWEPGFADPLWPLPSGCSPRYLVIFVHGGAGCWAGITSTIKVQVPRGRKWTIWAAIQTVDTEPASAFDDTILNFFLKWISQF